MSEQKRHGVISIAPTFWEELDNPNLANIKEKLLLPDDFDVELIKAGTDIYEVWVASDSIPDTGKSIVDVVPIYQRNKGNVALDHIVYH